MRTRPGRVVLVTPVMLVMFVMVVMAAAAPARTVVADRAVRAHGAARALVRGEHVVRVYGAALARGASPRASADRFVEAYGEWLGVTTAELDVADAQAVSADRFTLLRLRQHVDGVPVAGAELRLLARNAPGHPIVWANPASLRPLGAFRPRALGAAAVRRAVDRARSIDPGLARFTGARPVVWAGLDDVVLAPRDAIELHGAGPAIDGVPQRRRLVIDAVDGALLHVEEQVRHLDVEGTVRGRATEGLGPDTCGEEVETALPYARVTIGATEAFADEGGAFVIANAGTDPVTVRSGVEGRWFTVINEGGPNTVLELTVTPPGPAAFVHNAVNDDEFVRAEVNAYVQANAVRNLALRFNFTFPVIHEQTGFPINVNRDLSCAAFYDGSSVSVSRARSGCSNLAYSTIIHHEYGHHIVASGGSGQGAYGEGMADAMGVLVTDDPGLAYGFLGDCGLPLRSADNDCRYLAAGCSTCGDDPFSCGQVLSGAIWSTRERLRVTEPDDYRVILGNLAINSILLHTGSLIDPSITIDFLTLDDDDGTIMNGTPHYDEIAGGFGEHDLTAPPLCIADLDGDGAVTFGDLLLVLAAWGPCEACPEDLNGDATVDFADVLLVLAAWGACP